jgi:carboxynorspermidine decarboxylase
MEPGSFDKLDLQRVPSPCFVVDECVIQRNLDILKEVGDASGASVLAALKAFSMWGLADLYKTRLQGTCASGLHEARLGSEYYGGEVHVFSAAYKEADLEELLTFADHIVFNSCSQWLTFQDRCLDASKKRKGLAFGLRINPEHSEGAVPIYDPCAPGSRLGIPLSQLDEKALHGISGLHFHTLCEQGFEPLERTIASVEARFGHLLKNMRWLNLGGGHHITAEDYDRAGLIACMRRLRDTYDLKIYIEPGEAVALHAGVLVCEVLDITWNTLNQAILDTSATCHMPDVLEMPYRPPLFGAGEPGQFEHLYRLGGLTCLAGDVIGDYSFPVKLKPGQRLMFGDMAIYTMVKTTTFNGTCLPSLAIWNSESDELRVIREFGYEDFKNRLS